MFYYFIIIILYIYYTSNPLISHVNAFQLQDYTHYLDYLPYRQEGLAFFEDFRTAAMPSTNLRNRKMKISKSEVIKDVEDVLSNPKLVFPTKWPYGFEDFRPLDYTRDDIIDTLTQYQYSQSLIDATYVTLFPGILRLPIKRHFILPKDKIAFKEHIKPLITPKASILELYSTYESIIPYIPVENRGPVVGIGWDSNEMECNEDLDDYTEQDVSIDPYLPLQDNYFDIVIVPAMFQLFQNPLVMFQEINRVLKPGGTAVIGVKLAMWSFLGWKQGRYYAETNYLEDILALGSFFHYAKGYSKPQVYDLTLPEVNIVGKMKDVLFPQPRLDFYAVVEARKRKDSPHGRNTTSNKDNDEIDDRSLDLKNPIQGERYKPKYIVDALSRRKKLTPYS